MSHSRSILDERNGWPAMKKSFSEKIIQKSQKGFGEFQKEIHIKKRNHSNRKKFEGAMPFLPSSFSASHHFPDLSKIAKCSPFLNDSSLGSSAAPE
jgi:hypothetical protein